MNLSSLRKGELAFIEHVPSTAYSTRLIGLGLIPGKQITIENIGPFGSPYHVKVGSQSFLIDKYIAKNIRVRL